MPVRGYHAVLLSFAHRQQVRPWQGARTRRAELTNLSYPGRSRFRRAVAEEPPIELAEGRYASPPRPRRQASALHFRLGDVSYWRNSCNRVLRTDYARSKPTRRTQPSSKRKGWREGQSKFEARGVIRYSIATRTKPEALNSLGSPCASRASVDLDDQLLETRPVTANGYPVMWVGNLRSQDGAAAVPDQSARVDDPLMPVRQLQPQ